MPAKTHRIQRGLLYLAGGLFLLFVVAHIAGVALMRQQLEVLLHPAPEQGTYLGGAHLNLFSGLLEIERFELEKDAQTRIRLSDLRIDVSPWRLLTGHLQVNEVSVGSGYLRIERQPDGRFDLGLPTAQESGDSAADPGLLPLSIDEITLSRVSVDFYDDDLNSLMRVNELQLSNIDLSNAAQQIPLHWKMAWDQKRLDGDAELTIQDGDIAVKGNLQAEHLDLARIMHIARSSEKIAGHLAFAGGFAWAEQQLGLQGQLQLQQFSRKFEGQETRISRLQLPAIKLDVTLAEQPVASLDFGGKGLSAEKLEIALGDLHVAMDLFSLAGAWHFEQRRLALRNGQASARMAGLKVRDQKQQLALDLAELSLAKLALTGDQSGRQLDSQVNAKTIKLSLAGDQLKAQGLAAKMQLAVIEDKALETGEFAVELKGLDVLHVLGEQQLRLSLQALSLPKLLVSGDQSTQKLAGKLRASVMAAALADDRAQVQEVSADLAVTLAAEQAPRIRVDAGIQQLALSHANESLLYVERMALDEFAMDDDMQAAEVVIGGIKMGVESTPAWSVAESVQLTQLQRSSDGKIHIGNVQVVDMDLGVLRDQQGKWQHALSSLVAQDATAEQQPVQAPGANAGVAPADPVQWRLGSLSLSGKNQLRLADESVEPAMQLNIDLQKFEVGEIDSAQPQRDTPVSVVLKPDEFSTFVIEGAARPLQQPLLVDIKGHVEAFGLTTVNPLVADALGHRFLDGQLYDDYQLKIADGHLDMSNDLRLFKLEAEAIEGKEGPPLALAIALLEDKKGEIDLQLPVTGDMADPDFQVLGALNPIITKAVAGAAALAIQPLGSVLFVGSLLADQVLTVSFPSAGFLPGLASLDEKGGDYLKELAGKLQDRPKLRLRLCGRVVNADRRKDKKGKFTDTEEQLLKLAQERADVASTVLQRHGVAKTQLRACRPQLDKEEDGQARVDIGL